MVTIKIIPRSEVTPAPRRVEIKKILKVSPDERASGTARMEITEKIRNAFTESATLLSED